jgi:hypothetical protein
MMKVKITNPRGSAQEMKKTSILSLVLLGVLAVMASSGPIPPGPIGNFINNSAAPQNAQLNVGTATVRGALTAGSLVVPAINVATATATQHIGGGIGLTNLNPAEVKSGTIPASVVWNGVAVGTQYGGTGQDFSAITQGKIPYFSGTGVMGTVAAGVNGQVLQSGGPAGAPSFTGAPTILGTNITAIPVGGLAAGTLSVSVPASSITITGVVPGVYGGPTQSAQLTIRSDGRVGSITQLPIPGVSTTTVIAVNSYNWTKYQNFMSSVSVGSIYGSGVGLTNVPAASITAGSLGAGVIASSVAVNSVYPASVKAGTYGVSITGNAATATTASNYVLLAGGYMTGDLNTTGQFLAQGDIIAGVTSGAFKIGSVGIFELNGNTVHVGSPFGTGFPGDENTIIGVNAGSYASGTGSVLIGAGAGSNVPNSGNNNICIGDQTCTTNSTGHDNIIIGATQNGLSASSSNYLNLGGGITGRNVAGSTLTFLPSILVPDVYARLRGNADTATTATNWTGSSALQSQVNNIAVDTGSIKTVQNAVVLSTGVIAASDALKLPLAGGNMTGPLSGTSAVYSGSVTASSVTVTGSAFSVGGSTLVAVNGSVGIGKIPEMPAGCLDVAKGLNATTAINIIGTGSDSIAGGRYYQAGTGFEGWLLQTGAGGAFDLWGTHSAVFTQRLRVDNITGNVGIGTTAPSYKVDVSSGIVAAFGTGSGFMTGGQISKGVVTASAIPALVPIALGAEIRCSNCSIAYNLCVATGTLAGAWVISGTTNHCQ